jgi:regulator of sigma E protease
VEVQRDGEIKSFTVQNNYRKIVGITSTLLDGKTTNIVSPTDMSSPAYEAGIKDGDKVVGINDTPVDSWEDITSMIASTSSGTPVKITVERDGEIQNIEVEPEEQIWVRYNTQVEKSFVTAVASSAYKTVYYIKLMFSTISQLLTGGIGSDALGGPVMVISMVGEAAESGILSLLNLAAFISINLGFMNLLPIPALDGSKLVFLVVEAIRGKAIPIEKESYVHFIGFIVLIAFMLFITYKDILRLFRI